MKTSPTQRSLKLMRERGYHCEITEHWNPFAKIRKDLFGFVDILCMKGDCLVAVQTTSGENVTKRLAKIQALQAAELWLESPHRKITIHGWKKSGPRGGVKKWVCLEVELELT